MGGLVTIDSESLLIIVPASQFNYHIYHSVLNVKVLEGVFNQEKALVGAFFVIVKTDGSFAALEIRDMSAISLGRNNFTFHSNFY